MPSCSCRCRGRTMSSGCGQAERHEQQARLVDVPVVLVDHGDRDVAVGL